MNKSITKKRTFILLSMIILLSIIDIIVKHVPIFFIVSFLFFLSFTFLWLYAELLKIKVAKEYYKQLLENKKILDMTKHMRYKAYFIFQGKELEEKVKQYDQSLASCYLFISICIQVLKNYEKYLSKIQYQEILKIENETSSP